MKKACTNHIEIGSSDSVTSWFIIDNYCDVFVCHCNDWSLPRKWINNVSKCYNNSGILSAPYAIWFQSSNQLSHWDCWFLRQLILKINTFLSSNKLFVVLTIAILPFTLVFKPSFSLSQQCCDIRLFRYVSCLIFY